MKYCYINSLDWNQSQNSKKMGNIDFSWSSKLFLYYDYRALAFNNIAERNWNEYDTRPFKNSSNSIYF